MSAINPEIGAVEPSGPAPLRVLIADDHPLMLAGIRRTLERSENIEVVGEAGSGPEVLSLIERRRPQIVLLDMLMPGITGSQCIEQIRSSWPDIKVVVLSVSEDRASIDNALTAGASAYIVKNVIPSDIASVLRQVASGSVYQGFSASRPLAPALGADKDDDPVLTGRELTILAGIAAGKTTAAISEDLWVSQHTVKFHLTNVYRKLGVPNRAAAVRYALEHGLVVT